MRRMKSWRSMGSESERREEVEKGRVREDVVNTTAAGNGTAPTDVLVRPGFLVRRRHSAGGALHS